MRKKKSINFPVSFKNIFLYCIPYIFLCIGLTPKIYGILVSAGQTEVSGTRLICIMLPLFIIMEANFAQQLIITMFNDIIYFFSTNIKTITKSCFPPRIPASQSEDDIPFLVLLYFPPFQFKQNRVCFSIGLTFQQPYFIYRKF